MTGAGEVKASCDSKNYVNNSDCNNLNNCEEDGWITKTKYKGRKSKDKQGE